MGVQVLHKSNSAFPQFNSKDKVSLKSCNKKKNFLNPLGEKKKKIVEYYKDFLFIRLERFFIIKDISREALILVHFVF